MLIFNDICDENNINIFFKYRRDMMTIDLYPSKTKNQYCIHTNISHILAIIVKLLYGDIGYNNLNKLLSDIEIFPDILILKIN